ncbi:DnaJ like chaperone protein [Methylomagnum ishizawai]|uniref:Co-chaperone protein DjlA n=1 Tax=Methylomagnum ishizawai TaxID=1760988 RepID=A0A1Y6CSX6_9GAMM|nr:co-chaperone DjlA [Methylomagnum ishizawai]SMF93416.1 DnaJ like chaperone protein [Methylomagnum ishizawai]
MTWFGKVVGGTFGLFMGGPLGAIFGAALGHQLDRKAAEAVLLEAEAKPGERQRVQAAFLTATFSVMGHVAKADGRVNEAEIDFARAMMNRLELPEETRRAAIRLYGEGKRPEFALDGVLDQFQAECQQRHALLRMFVEIQLESALADGVLNGPEERLLLRLCDRLRFSRFEFHTMRARMEAERRFARPGGRGYQWGRREVAGSHEFSLAQAYTALGVSPADDEDAIKRAYRRLMSRHHPDKRVAQGESESQVAHANEKTQQIRKAYETIAKARKF